MKKRLTLWLPIILAIPLSPHFVYGQDPIEDGWQKAMQAIEQGNFQLAVDTWLPLAEKGHAGSGINLAKLIEEHIELADSNPQVVNFIRKSAHRDNIDSQFLMIKIYLHQQQPEKAKYWLNKAENNKLLWDSDKANIEYYRKQLL